MKIIYLLGRGRSGSTLLSFLLGSQKNILNVGELKNFWEYHCREDKMGGICSDGIKLNNHPFWTEIRNELKNQLDEEFPNLKAENKTDFQKNNTAMFDAIFRVSGEKYIVDASKKFERLKKLLKFNKNIYTIHVVRDPRAYANSIIKYNKRRIEVERKKPVNVSSKVFIWGLYNLYIKFYFKIRRVKHITVSYEDLVDNPQKNLHKILNFVGYQNNTTINFSKNQPVFCGNFWFLESKETKIKKDELYKKSLTKKQFLYFTMLSFPVLLFYGYPLKRN